MKSNKLILAAITASLCLPISSYAGGDKSHGDKKDKHDSSTASSEHLETPHMGADRYMTENPEPGFSSDRDTEDSFAMGDESESASEWRRSSESRMQLTSSHIKKVEERELRDKVMAEDLVGKTVVDRDGQEIGEVKSIALTSLDKQSSQSSSPGGLASGSKQRSQGLVHLYIEPKEGDSLLEVPMSELTFNEQQEELQLDLAQSDLESLTRSTASVAITD